MMIVLACMTGGGSLPFSGGALIYGGYLTQATGVTIPYMPYIIFAVTIYGLALVLMFIVFKFVFKLRVDKFMISDEIAAELEKKESTKQQRVTFVILIIYIVALLLPGIIPNAPGMALLNKLGVVGVSAIGLLVLNFIVIEEKPLIDIGKTFAKHVQWPLMLLLAVTFPLADAIKHADSGIMVTITQAVTPLISDMGITTFMIVSMIILGIITQFTHNVVLGAMFIPFLCPICQDMGGNMITFWFMIYIALNAAYVTPAGSMNSAMVHGHECMNKKDAYIMGLVYLLIIFALLIVIGLPLGNILF